MSIYITQFCKCVLSLYGKNGLRCNHVEVANERCTTFTRICDSQMEGITRDFKPIQLLCPFYLIHCKEKVQMIT